MKKILLLLAVASSSASAFAEDVYVPGYVRNNGTYVQPYHRTAPDNTTLNNYSTQGNVNPYTGQQGHVQPNQYNSPSLYQAPAPTLYQQPQQYRQPQPTQNCLYGQRC
ncbi:hypothetical protein V8G57_09125 [Collimonas sp. H4R21]|uniref:Uncharacterized protein n=1 Tax=Collimonas rhizosphaerae TaxID=3126357 RepID=A0ABU9PU82_9BURK